MSRTKLKTKRLTDYPKPYQECIAIWKAFRQLGFEADDIFFGFGPVDGEQDVVHMELITQGKEFVVAVGQMPGATYEGATKIWQEVATLATKVSHEEIEAVFRSNPLGRSTKVFVVFAAEILKKGFILPAFAEKMPHVGQA